MIKIKSRLIENYNNLEKYFKEKDTEYKRKLENSLEQLKIKKYEKEVIYNIRSQYNILQTISIKNIEIEKSYQDIIQSFDFSFKDNKRIYIIHSENITKYFENSKLKGRINQQNLLNSRFRERIVKQLSN